MAGSSAQTVPAPAMEMGAVTILSPRVANQEPVFTVATPASALRYEPAVDLQARSFAEGQADIAIRGGYAPNERVQAVRLMDNEFIPVASPDYLV